MGEGWVILFIFLGIGVWYLLIYRKKLDTEEKIESFIYIQQKKGKTADEIIQMLRNKGIIVNLSGNSTQTNLLDIKSDSSTGSYHVDTINITCTCPDFSKRRSSYGKKDPRRLCKHLVRGIEPFIVFENDNDIAEQVSNIKEKGFGFPVGDKFVHDFGYGPVTIYIDNEASKFWIDVFADQSRYGFNVQEQRWSYGEGPTAEEAIAKWVTNNWIKINGEIEFKPNQYDYEYIYETKRPANEEKAGIANVDSIETTYRAPLQSKHICALAHLPNLVIASDISSRKGKNINVFTGLSDYELVYNVQKEAWQDTAPPLDIQPQVEKWLKKEWEFVNSKEFKISKDKDVAGVETSLPEMIAYYLIKDMLSADIDSEKIQCVDRKTYFVIYVESVRKWLYRLHIRDDGSGKIEFQDGDSIYIKNVYEINNHKEKLIKKIKGSAGTSPSLTDTSKSIQ